MWQVCTTVVILCIFMYIIVYVFINVLFTDCTAKVWDLDRGIELATLPKHPSYVRKILYSEASNLLFTAFQSQIKVLI